MMHRRATAELWMMMENAQFARISAIGGTTLI